MSSYNLNTSLTFRNKPDSLALILVVCDVNDFQTDLKFQTWLSFISGTYNPLLII